MKQYTQFIYKLCTHQLLPYGKQNIDITDKKWNVFK